MKSVSLVKLIRATCDDTGHPSFSYEIKVHAMNGLVRTEVITDTVKSRDYCKQLKMKSGMNHAVRHLNSYKWEVITEESYNLLLQRYTEE